MSIEIIKGVKRKRYKKVVVENSFGLRSYATEPDGIEVADIKVIVDFAQVAHSLGVKAMANKSGISKALYGAIVVSVVGRKIAVDTNAK